VPQQALQLVYSPRSRCTTLSAGRLVSVISFHAACSERLGLPCKQCRQIQKRQRQPSGITQAGFPSRNKLSIGVHSSHCSWCAVHASGDSAAGRLPSVISFHAACSERLGLPCKAQPRKDHSGQQVTQTGFAKISRERAMVIVSGKFTAGFVVAPASQAAQNTGSVVLCHLPLQMKHSTTHSGVPAAHI
jgi:hypothetical protein